MKNIPYSRTFYRALNKWISQGCPNHPIFCMTGICRNYKNFLISKNKNPKLIKHLMDSFISQDLDQTFPFNDSDYAAELSQYKIYKNPKRLAWIKDHCK